MIRCHSATVRATLIGSAAWGPTRSRCRRDTYGGTYLTLTRYLGTVPQSFARFGDVKMKTMFYSSFLSSLLQCLPRLRYYRALRPRTLGGQLPSSTFSTKASARSPADRSTGLPGRQVGGDTRDWGLSEAPCPMTEPIRILAGFEERGTYAGPSYTSLSQILGPRLRNKKGKSFHS